jgi:hypothetical protein
MNLLKKIFHKQDSHQGERLLDPSGMAIFSAAENDRFVQMVSAYFQQRGETFRIEDGAVLLPEKNLKLNLQNLAQNCHQNKVRTWRQIVQNHFAHLDKMGTENPEIQDALKNFHKIAPRLAVRIWPLDTLDTIGRDYFIYREDLWATASVLVLDLPDCVDNIQPKNAVLWEEKTEVLFKVGLANVREQCKPERYVKELAQGIKVHVVTSESLYTATYALLLDEFSELVGRYGSLVCIPNRHVLACYPIEGSEVLLAMQQLMPIIDDLFRKGPGSISPHLYWYNQGKYSPITFDVRKKTIYLPPDFEAVLNQLAGKATTSEF